MFPQMLRLRINQYLKEAIQTTIQLGLPTRRGRERHKATSPTDAKVVLNRA
jgi:hypothetical protein